MDSSLERWHLASGVWVHDVLSHRWKLESTREGLKASVLVSPADLSRFAGAARKRDDAVDPSAFPPEFLFSPVDGAALSAPPAPATAPWVAPYGAAPLLKIPRPGSDSHGLRQTAHPLRPQGPMQGGRQQTLSPTDDAPYALKLPPPGRYEFCVGRFGANCDVLVAIEPEKGALFVWAPLEQAWLAMEPIAAGPFAETATSGNDWRMELAQEGTTTILYLATLSGLAVVRADVLSLTYSVTYVGGGAALGGPIQWAGEVWAPVRGASGGLVLSAASGRTVESCTTDPVAHFAPPVSDSRQVIWPSEQGQLVLRKGPDGKLEASWVRWPQSVVPRFEFGCPYLSRTGSFWQLCWDEGAGSYRFVQMARPAPETYLVDSPHLCTGVFSFQRGHWIKKEPWQEETRAYDTNSDEVVVPLLESTAHGAVLGLVIDTTVAAAELLESGARQRAALRYQAEDSADVPFFTLQVARPWSTRVFVYDARLWVYHPDLTEAHGWAVET